MSNVVETRMTREMFDAMWLPKYPLAGDDKGAAKQMSREEAKTKRYIQSNLKELKNLIVLDYDYDGDSDFIIKVQIEEGIIPEPNWITVNPHNGHAQAVYVIDGFVSTPEGIEFFDNTALGLRLASTSDLGYRNYKMKNPLHPAQATEWMSGKPLTLKELAAFTPPMDAHFYTKKNMLPELGRNNVCFNLLSAFSYREWRKPMFETRILVEAERINQTFEEPLPLSELVGICNSVERFIKKHFTEEKFQAIQRARANKRWQGQGARTNEKFFAMVEAGLTIREIAENENMTLAAARKAVQRAKKAAVSS